MRPSTFYAQVVRRTAGLVFLLFMTSFTCAQITPLGDSYINTAAPTTNYGAKTLLDVDGATQATYIQFDLSSIPSGYTGSNIAKASLKLYVNAVTTAGSFNVDYVNGAWTEGTIDASNAPPPGATIAASVALAKAQVHDYVVIDLTSALQAWLNGTETNYGIALVANGSLNASFDSKESTTTSQPPELDVVFAGSGGGGITGVLTGTASGLQGGGTSGTLNLSLLTSCSSGQVLAWNGSAWACSSPSGGGTITGVTAGTDLTGGGTSGNVTVNLDITQVPQLNYSNTFTGNQTVNGNLSATGLVTGTAFDIGSNLFAFGSYATGNVLLGFAGNSTMTGTFNTASGYQALQLNATGARNTASGYNALGSNISGWYNTASGAYALTANTNGSSNTAHGYAALSANTNGADNTASGAQALGTNTLGSLNVAVGASALLLNVGDSAGDGSYNTAVGVQALEWNNDTGGSGVKANYNTALGYDALYSNTAGSYNTAVGYNAGPDSKSTGLTNSTAIGANAVVSQSNALVLGGTGSNLVNVGIGTATPAYTLDVQGSGRFTQPIVFASGQTFPGTGTITGVTAGTALTGGGTSGNVTLNVDTTKVVTGVVAGTDLTGGGTGGNVTLNLNTANVPLLAAANTFTGNQTVNGNLSATGVVTGSSYQIGSNLFAFGTYTSGNAFLGFAGNSTMAGYYNTATGFEALQYNTLGYYNTAIGQAALYSNTTGIINTAVGRAALFSNTTGEYNTASGVGALSTNTTGGYNTASGEGALSSNTTGGGNTATGQAALYSNTTASNNTATGAVALYSNTTGYWNTASGDQALYSNTTGYSNTASGMSALYSNTTGYWNTASGYQALYSNTTGINNTADGYQALSSNTGGIGNTATGYQVLYQNSGTGNYGAYNTGSGNQTLYANTTGSHNTAFGAGALVANTTGDSNTAVGFQALEANTTGSGLTCIGVLCTASEDALRNATAIGAHAVVGASNSLVLGGTGDYAVKVGIGTTTPSNILTIAQGAGQPLSDGWATFSSRRWKTNIHTLHDALGIVEQLRGVSYDLKATGQHEVGVIAEEVGAVVPEVVTWEKNGKDAQSVDYGRLTALLIEATKEQQALIQKQHEQIKVQQAQMKAQQSQMEAQQARIDRLTRQVKTIQTTLKANGQSGSAVRAVKAEATTIRQ